MASKQTQISLIHAFSILKILAVSGVFSSIDFRGPRSSSITVIHNSHASFSDGEETPPHKQPLLLYSTGFKGAVSNKKLDPKVVITQISSVRHAPLIELHSETREKLQNTTILGAMGWKKEDNQFCHIYYSPYISSYHEIFTRPYRMCHVHSFASLIFLNRES
jgi:hypothetical protein